MTININTMIQYLFLTINAVFNIGEGTIDMDLINTGVSASERMRRDILVSSIRDITLEKMQIGGSAMRLSEVY